MPRRRAESPAFVGEVVYGGSGSEDESDQEDPAPSVQQRLRMLLPARLRQLPAQQLQPPPTLQQLQSPMLLQQPVQPMPIPVQQPQPQPTLQQSQAQIPPPQQPQPALQQSQAQIPPPQQPQPAQQQQPNPHLETLQVLEKLLKLKEQYLLHPRAPLTPQPREMDGGFVVPAASPGKHRIAVVVPPFTMVSPVVRPSRDIPVQAQYLANDRFAPRIGLLVQHSDFSISGKFGGKVRFTPARDWPESTARVCVFYYIGTQNTGKWSRSEFATLNIDLNARDQHGNLKEVSTNFVISLPKSNTTIADAKNLRLIKQEQIGIVAVACAGATIIRGEETTFDYGLMEAALREQKIHLMTRRAALFDHMQQLQQHVAAFGAQPMYAAAAARFAFHPYMRS